MKNFLLSKSEYLIVFIFGGPLGRAIKSACSSKVQEEGYWWGQGDLVSLHLQTILTGQGNFSKLQQFKKNFLIWVSFVFIALLKTITKCA